jgi:inward rectifier potassium channel
LISSIESFIGLLGIALVTGLLYGRFSRPVAKIRYAKNAVIAPFKEGKAFMMKMANRRSSKLIESEVTMVLSVTKETGRVNLPMKLDLKKINFFALSWVVVHPIDDESPFKDFTQEDLENGNAEVIILLKAFDDTFSQTVYSRMSYKHDEIVWNAKYISSIGAEGSQLTIDLDRIDDIEILD